MPRGHIVMPEGHHPREVTPEENWLLEGNCYLDGEFRRTRLEIAAGSIKDEGDLPGSPHLTLDDSLLVLPGFLDIHVHCRDDADGSERYKEDFASASRAALHGGVVLVGDMPNNPDPPLDEASYARKRRLAQERALVDVVLYGGIAANTRPFSACIPYKCYYGPSVGQVDLTAPGSSPGMALAPYRDHFIAFHAEDPEVLETCRHAPTHEQRRPPEAEARAIASIAELARIHSFRPHIAHLSSAAGLAEIRKARARGLPMTCEVTPHHLYFDLENRSTTLRGEWLQMNPPLRTPTDREALRAAFLSGEIELLATDHAPHSLEENQKGISGVPQLDTFAAFLTLLAREGIPWSTLIDRAASAPAKLFAPFLPGRLGSLTPGSLASFTVIDPERPWRVNAADLSTRAAWSPFEGTELPGRVLYTAVRGKLHEMA